MGKEEIEKDIANILDHETPKPVVNVNITTQVPNKEEDNTIKIEEPIKDEEPIKVEDSIKAEKPTGIEKKEEGTITLPTYEEVEKPKINIDVDSVVSNNDTKPTNDDFFDDFFGGEDE